MYDFDYLVSELKKEGYKVEVEICKLDNSLEYKSANIRGKNIKGGFCSEHTKNNLHSSHHKLNGQIAIDHIECFDKWSKCPMVLPIPKNEKQLKYVIEQLEFWGSESGYYFSSTYYFDEWVDSYPEEICL